jgi:hypothetical protein
VQLLNVHSFSRAGNTPAPLRQKLEASQISPSVSKPGYYVVILVDISLLDQGSAR